MSRSKLIELAKQDLDHALNGTVDQADNIYRIPVDDYLDADRWQAEVDRVFRRLPMLAAATAEMSEPGSYKAITIAGTPVLLTRTKSGSVNAFVNMCSHRGSRLKPDGSGKAGRFTCPYHAWTYGLEGNLISVYSEEIFGEIDKSCHGLKPLPVLEKAGLIWVIVDPRTELKIEEFLSGYDEMLAHFEFENWHHLQTNTFPGPNWKVAFDGNLDFYHVPILHRHSFGSDNNPYANYSNWGPHIHVSMPDASYQEYAELPDEQWPLMKMLGGVWTVFPNSSIASFDGTVAETALSTVTLTQLFPGDTPESSYTHQIFLTDKAPPDEISGEHMEQFTGLLQHVLREEDYGNGLALQESLKTRAMSHVTFGKNERGGQMYHQWIDRIVETADEDLPALFNSQ